MSIKISELPSASYIGSEDYIPIVQNGTTKKGTANMINNGEYTQVEYIESTGTQYIDTNFSPNNNTKLEINLEFTSNSTGFLFCGRDFNGSTAKNAYGLLRTNNSNVLGLRLDYSTGGQTFTRTTATYTKYMYTLNKNNLYENETLIRTATAATFNTTNKLLLLAAANESSVITAFLYAKVYYCKIWDNDTLVRDFIPVVKNSTGEAGLLDKVNGVFYGNSGTGNFNFGRNEEIYSTSEQRIGTWIDGKPLYQRFVSFAVPVATTAGTVVTGTYDIPSTVEYAFIKMAQINRLNEASPQINSMPLISPITSDGVVTGLRRTQINVQIYGTKRLRVYNSDEGISSSSTIDVILCYTKSTDTATRGTVEQTRGLTKGGIDEDNMITPVEENKEEEKKEEEPIEKKSEEVVKENNEVSGEELKELGDEPVDEQTK